MEEWLHHEIGTIFLVPPMGGRLLIRCVRYKRENKREGTYERDFRPIQYKAL